MPIEEINLNRDSPWFMNAVFYEVHLRSFSDSNGDGKGDLPGLTSRLDYLADLGVDCVWLLPMFPSPLADDGYDISDYTAIHPDYGTVEDFRALVSRAHDLGLRVIADLVINHTSDQHPWFREARSSRDNRYRDYYVWSDTPDRYGNARVIFVDTEESNWTFDEKTGQYYWHRFYSSQPDLNFENPEVADAVIDVMRFWLNMGLDGFRADAVPYLFEAEGTSCENLPPTHDYLKRIRRMMDQEYPGTILLGEANQWPDELRPYFGDGDELNMAFHFPLMPRIFKALVTGSTTDIVRIMRRTPAIPANCQWCVFLRNHDELTLEMVTPEDRTLLWNAYAPDPRMRLNLGIRRRLAPLLGNDRRKIELANAVLFSIGGTPVIYYGDEIGMGDDVQLADRNGVRTPMQWTGGRNAGFSTASPEHLWAPVITGRPYGYELINVEDQSGRQDSLLGMTRRFIRTRKANPILGYGDCIFIRASDPGVLAFVRAAGNDTLLVVANFSDRECRVDLALDQYEGRTLVDVFTGMTDPEMPGPLSAPTTLTLAPYGYHWKHIV